MKMWFGHKMLECECGYSSPDKAEFEAHLTKLGHKPKTEAVKKVSKKNNEPKEENNDGLRNE